MMKIQKPGKTVRFETLTSFKKSLKREHNTADLKNKVFFFFYVKLPQVEIIYFGME